MTLAWYCVRTSPRSEEKVQRALQQALGLVAYLPVERSFRKKGKTREVVRRPLISRHLFFGVRDGGNVFEKVRETNGVQVILSSERDGPPREVPWRALAIVQTIEGELDDAFAKRLEPKKYGDDTDEFIERVKALPPERRAEEILAMLGRGRKAKVNLATFRELV